MDEFKKFNIFPFEKHLKEVDDTERTIGETCPLNDLASRCCPSSPDAEIFPSPFDIYEVRKAWYGHQSVISDDLGLGSSSGPQLSRLINDPGADGRRARTHEKNPSIGKDASNRKCPEPAFQLSADSVMHGRLSTAPSNTDITTTSQLERVVCCVRSFATDNGRILNLGNSYKTFNRFLIPMEKEIRIKPEIRFRAEHNVCHSQSNQSNCRRSETNRTTISSHGNISSGMHLNGRKSDETQWSDLEISDASDECKELLNHDRSSNEDDAESPSRLFRGTSLFPGPESSELRQSDRGGGGGGGGVDVSPIALKTMDANYSEAGLRSTGSAPLRDRETEEQWEGREEHLLRVVVVGGRRVGKSTLTQQLLTSEYHPNYVIVGSGNSISSDDDNVVVVEVDQVQSLVQFIEIQSKKGIEREVKDKGDVFLVLYSITDHSSFKTATTWLRLLCRKSSSSSSSSEPVIILVANKQDLVRRRVVSEQSGKRVASKRNCKFIEVSAFLDHRLDELLVGILKQTEIHQRRRCAASSVSASVDDDDDELRELDADATAPGCLLNSIRLMRFWKKLSSTWPNCQSFDSSAPFTSPSASDDLLT